MLAQQLRVAALGVVATFGFVGCDSPATDDESAESTGSDGGVARPLASAYAWQLADPASDPFAQMRPAGTPCDEAGLGVEDGAGGPEFEIDTAACNYASLRQPALTTAIAGETLRVRIWHDDLTSLGGEATGYVGVHIADAIVYEADVPIPAEAGLLSADLTLLDAFEVGTDVVVHVHNHGENTWSIVELSVSS